MFKYLTSFILFGLLFAISSVQPAHAAQGRFFDVQAIDTMKFSRDMAREHGSSEDFKKVINIQVSNIAATGATHVSLSTPYDEEFVPFLQTWVAAARKHKLKVWFRGNVSGWEGWFDYPKIDRKQHTEKVYQYILTHPQLFEDGDIFSSCPECENGGPGDPRMTGDTEDYRKFLIAEYQTVKSAFAKIRKNVQANYFSMNGDVAKLIMDKETTAALDGIVTIDHYVKTPEQLNADINYIAEQSGGKIVLGEFGVPIPDIHGSMSQSQQKDWLEELFGLLAINKNVVGVNYWTSYGSSTEIWDSVHKPHLAVGVLSKYYKPLNISGRVVSRYGQGIEGALVSIDIYSATTDKKGAFSLAYLPTSKNIDVVSFGYASKKIPQPIDKTQELVITLDSKEPSLFEKLIRALLGVFS